jgi:hypothetical protein
MLKVLNYTDEFYGGLKMHKAKLTSNARLL